MKPGSRLGFVTPASWLTSDYAVALQKLLLGELKLIAVVSSNAESFFPPVDINAVLLVAQKTENASTGSHDAPLRFVTLLKPIRALVAGKGSYWERVVTTVDFILGQTVSFEDDRMRIKVVPLEDERAALADDPTTPRNWSKYLRAPLSYYSLFGEAA